MGGNCNSSPTSGCTDKKTLEQLVLITDMVETKLTSIINKKIQIIIDLNACSDANNAILEDIITQYETIITNDCCEETQEILQDIIDELNNLIVGESCELIGSIECNIEVTTTEEVTTIEPTTTETPTTTLLEDTGVFFVSNVMQLPCIEESLPAENEKTLYFTGTFGTGVQVYTDFVGGTLLSGYTYIKADGSLSVYNLGSENGLVGTVAYTCE